MKIIKNSFKNVVLTFFRLFVVQGLRKMSEESSTKKPRTEAEMKALSNKQYLDQVRQYIYTYIYIYMSLYIAYININICI